MKAKLIHGDCLDHLEEIITEYKPDIVITDLPYGLTQNKNDTPINLKRMWELLKGIPFITTSQQPFTTDLINSNRKGFKYMWYWDKVNKTNHLNAKKQPLRHIEEIIVFNVKNYYPQYTKGKMITHGRGHGTQNRNYGKITEYVPKTSDLRFPKQLLTFKKPFAKLHATQKPVELMEYIIKTYTKEGDVVLDLTMGSGTTGVACINLNRNFVGVEKDKDTYEVARERIKEVDNGKKW